MIVRTAFDVLPSPARVHAPDARAVAGRARAAGMESRPRRARPRDRRRHPARGGRGRATRVPARADAVAVLRGRAAATRTRPAAEPEALPGGPTFELAARAAHETGAFVHASCYEAAPDGGLGYNTAFVVAPDGALVARRRKTHLPSPRATTRTRGSGPAIRAGPSPPSTVAAFGFPTCWDQWFPETSRAFALGGAEVLVYPTAIGSEPDHPGFDTEPQWEQVIRAQGIMNGTFMVAVNRTGPKVRSRSTDRRSSAIRTGGCSCRRRAPNPRCWSPISISTSPATGSISSR